MLIIHNPTSVVPDSTNAALGIVTNRTRLKIKLKVLH